MSISQIFTQVVVIFLLMLLGVVIRKLGFLHSQSINDLTNIILYFLSPIVIIKAFEQPFSRARFNQLLVLVVAVFLTYFVSILLASLLFRRVRDQNIRRIAIYGSTYSNNGFMGIPLAQGLFGSIGVFYAVASMIGFNVMSWTQGIGIFQDRTQRRFGEQFKKIILNPNIIAIIVGLIMFVTSYHLPKLLSSFIDYTSPAFTPMAMIVIGCNLANLSLKDVKLPGSLWVSLVVRDLVFPILGALILLAMGVSGVPMVTTVILSACPVAGLVVLFTLQAGGDAKPATILMSISTILSLVTIPIVYGIVSLW
ncbi:MULTISPECIES: AEC family transporter [Limosilactobacillus]|uniref:AEC family transporter n=1 Tax=Limosilactobacillus TaxID=2742598 RepID=UPI0022460BC3|nr:AEC family transporter [Limosilactobacillus pontis]MCX2186357.1 AEC family transporter [Limosilactobacillus pontis]MCX2188043.1 AEC family transporter [Limosilactobacillus pontis]